MGTLRFIRHGFKSGNDMKVFISHSNSDEKLARRIATILLDSGVEVWDSQREIMPGDNWAAKVGQALERSDAMVVLLTPDALRSSSVRHEIDYALGDKGYSNRVIPVMVGPSSKPFEAAIPWILRHLPVVKVNEPDNDDESIRQIVQVILEAA